MQIYLFELLVWNLKSHWFRVWSYTIREIAITSRSPNCESRKKDAPNFYWPGFTRTSTTINMTENYTNNTEQIFPEMPEPPKVTIPKLPDLIDACGCPFRKALIVFGIATLILLVILGALSLISFINHGEWIHVKWGNDGRGFHWPTNNHGIFGNLWGYG